MNYQTLFVTHVELASHFIKIHGQTNRERAKLIEKAAATITNIFRTFPQPVIKMLDVDCMVLVYYNRGYYRGKFISADADKTAIVLLIDTGNTVIVELANLRVLSLAPTASKYLMDEPPLASEFILNRCVTSEDFSLSKIQDDILFGDIPYNIDDEIGNITRISLQWKGRDYTEHLINSRICKPITSEQQKKYLAPSPLTVARPVNTARVSINTTGMQMINHHLGVRNKPPPNMPSFQPRVSPSMDFNSNYADKQPPTIIQNEPLTSHYMPTFISDTLIVHGRHQVYVTHVDDGPYMFSIQVKSSEQKMEQMMAAIANCQLEQLSRKPALGMACLARYSGDNTIYRAVVKSIHPDSCKLLYVDYGNSEKVLLHNIYNIPEQFLRQKTFALRVSLAGLKNLPALSEHVKTVFKDMVTDKTLDMVVVPADGKAFVQYCELSINGESMLNRLKDIMSEIPKFIEPATLNNDDFVIIRYVESPKLFCVQQTKNIVEYNAMMDKLCQYCMTAPALKKLQTGIACAARFKSDSEWYRAEIVTVNGSNALIRFVDYGIELKTDIDALKEIRYDFLMIPKQAVRCCLLGFESIQTPSNSSQDQMELLAEDSLGERRNFRVKIHGNVADALLINLTDESQSPHLNLSMRMLQLSMPQKSFRQYELQHQNKVTSPRSINALPVNDAVDPHLHAASDSGFQDCATTSTRLSNWNTPQNTPNRDSKANSRSNGHHSGGRDDSGICSSNMSSPAVPETFKIDAKESKFYKNNHHANSTHDSNEERNARQAQPYTSANFRKDTLSPEGPIDSNIEIPIEAIMLNHTQEVQLAWFFSPLEFYVTTVKSDADLDYTTQMKRIHHFYKDRSPITETVAIGSLVIARYSKTNQLHRAKIVDFNENLKKYKAQLIDVGALTIVDAADVYEMDKFFAKLECQAIRCSLHGVALRKSRFDVEDIIDRLMGNKKLLCKFIKKKGETFYVDIEVGGTNVKDVLLRDEYLSILSEDIEIERLVGQTVMAQIESVKDLSSFQIAICGCETIFEASYQNTSFTSKSNVKKLPTGVTIPIRIDSLLLGQTFAVTPLIEDFGETPSSPIFGLSFFSNNFKVVVMHWESYNVAYVQSVTAHMFAESMLNSLFDFYEHNDQILQEFMPQTLCAVKSADGNWYRAEIVSENQADVNVRYLDYGNCELVPKNLTRRLESQFYNTAALAVKVYLPLEQTSVDEIAKLTEDITLDLKVLAYHAQNWIVDFFKEGISIISAITTQKSMTVDEPKKQIAEIADMEMVARLQIQKQQKNREVDVKSTVTITEVQPMRPATTTSQNTPPTTQQNVQLDNKSAGIETSSSRTKAFISHIDRPDRFFLQCSSITDALDQLQENIQIVAPSLPALENFAVDTRCIVRYSVDEQWYRAAIIDSDSVITSILFIDYGNTDTISDNSWIKSMNDTFDQIPAYAIPCALPLEAKDRIEWSEESCELLKSLTDSELEFEYVCKGKSNNFVTLYQGERDIMQELIHGGYAIKIDSIISGANCYISHVNSISDFYIQMESDTDALEKVADYLRDESKFEVMTDVKEGVVCAAKYSDDGSWYRGKIRSHKADSTEVFFIDYGNASTTNELRIIPTEIANAPSLAKYCSMVKPKDIQYWSESAEARFVEITDNGTIFLVDVISPGKQSIVDLVVDGKSILEDISNLCDKYTLSALEHTLQSDGSASEVFRALIVDGSPGQFYIQLESDSSELDQLCVALENAATWPPVDEIVVGQMCVGLFDGSYYRAKILSLSDQGAIVHYVDYGNQSFSADLRKLPENLRKLRPLAICCSLESKNGNFSPQMIERFASLSRNDAYDMKFVSKDSSPAIVQLFENGIKFVENAETKMTEPIGMLNGNSKLKAYISERIAPNHFYIQLNNDMEEAMTSASEFPVLEDSCKCAGLLCAALWEGAYYRAEILAVDEEGTKVHFIDYGNESYATDLRKLPENLAKIDRASMLCTLESENDTFSGDFVDRFAGLDLENEYEFEVRSDSSPCVVRLYVNGELFADEKSDKPKIGPITANSDSISIVNGIVDATIESSDQRRVADEKENSLNGTDATGNSSATVDLQTEADRIQQEHFKSVQSVGMGSY